MPGLLLLRLTDLSRVLQHGENSGSGLTKAMQRRLSYTSKDEGCIGSILPCGGHAIEPVWKASLIKTVVTVLIKKAIIMKLIKVGQVAKEPWADKLFTGPVTLQAIIGRDLSENFFIQQVNFSKGVRILNQFGYIW
jgi:hypothetical protein